jgi:hypothetical protein
MASIKKAGPYNPQKATAYVGKGVLKKGGVIKKAQKGDTLSPIKGSITPVPNGPLIKKKGPYAGSTLKSGGKVKLTTPDGEKHVVYKKTSNIGKGKKGDIMVNHPTTDKGKWDTIDLTNMGRAKTVKQGVASVKKWHAKHPEYGKKSSMAKKRR